MPQNQTTIPGDFNLNISVSLVFGASFYTFQLDGSSTNVENVPMTNFNDLNSGQRFMISVTVTKTTSERNFTSQALVFSEITSKIL